eukprot:1921682-Rhodomonas_salina.1
MKEQADLKQFCAHVRELAKLPDVELPGALLANMDKESAVNMLKGVQLPAPMGPAFSQALEAVLAAELLAQAQDLIKDLRDGKLEQA